MKSDNWKIDLSLILNKLGINGLITYSDFKEAFTHPSYANENNLNYNYQRLEFLGDSLIGFLISKFLYKERIQNKKLNDGEMSNFKSRIVQGTTMAMASDNIGLLKIAYLGKGINKKNVVTSIKEDLFESFIGAIYKSFSIREVQKVLDQTLIYYYQNKIIDIDKDWKTKFQEIVQSHNQQNSIEYRHSDNNQIKISHLFFNNLLFGIGEGNNYKDADQNAAKNAFEKYIQNN